MLSIVICSRKKVIDPILSQNIQESIGVIFDLVYIDNSNNQYDIFEAYNIAIQKCQYEIICFMHDDIKYKTNQWGYLVLKHFNNINIGAIGIAGTPYVSAMPGTWWSAKLVAQNIIQDGRKEVKYYNSFLQNLTVENGNWAPVALLDGVWLCVRKSLFNNIQFDQHTYKGFHMYDIDISMQINQIGFDLACIYDIDIEHQSIGKLNANWVTNRVAFYKKWKQKLPFAILPYSFFDKMLFEYRNLFSFLKIKWKQ